MKGVCQTTALDAITRAGKKQRAHDESRNSIDERAENHDDTAGGHRQDTRAQVSEVASP